MVSLLKLYIKLQIALIKGLLYAGVYFIYLFILLGGKYLEKYSTIEVIKDVNLWGRNEYIGVGIMIAGFVLALLTLIINIIRSIKKHKRKQRQRAIEARRYAQSEYDKIVQQIELEKYIQQKQGDIKLNELKYSFSDRE